MTYDFSKFLKKDSDILLDEFIDNYTALINTQGSSSSKLITKYKEILNIFTSPFDEKEILKLFGELAEEKLVQEYPYIIISHEIHCLQNILAETIASQNTHINIVDFFTLFNKINNKVADIYLNQYIEKLLALNHIRINSISDLVDRNIIKHYEEHLLWLNKLAIFIQNHKQSQMPELNKHKCVFGKWLDTQAKELIQNSSRYQSIVTLHTNLHTFGTKIQKHIDNNEQHILITYLEKCEFLSLSIGTELALIDNTLTNKKFTKDELTGAMNRNALKNIFHNQYEFSLSTANIFVLIMCDLDFFKNINDTYGHIVGDKVLKNFVNTCKQHTRNSDIIIRYGGEEFVIILPAITKEKGFNVANTIRKAFEQSVLEFENQQIKSTVSMGLVEIKPKNYYKPSFLNEYINIADQKLYMAKQNGRNRVELC